MRPVFISYGAPDEKFAKAINQELNSVGINTFFFPKHATPGVKLHRIMHKEIDASDKVVMICSANSLNRNGILNELEEVLSKEAREGGKSILVPITIDDYVFNEWVPEYDGHATSVRDRVIADFRGAINSKSKFKRAMSILLKSLEVAEGIPHGFKGLGLKYFTNKSFPLDAFYNQDVVVVCSSLYAPPNDKSKNYFSLCKEIPDENGEVRQIPVGSGFNVTGIRDVFGLTKITIALIERKTTLTLVVDPVDPKLKNENLCLIGGKSSNLIARELYQNFLSGKHDFHGKEGGYDIHGKNFKGGGYAHILSIKSPWNEKKRILWLAGLGPLGTDAAIHFITNCFKDSVPSEITKNSDWVLFIKGVANNGIITDVNQIGYYIMT